MTYRIRGLDPAPFSHLFGKSEAVLQGAGATRYMADATPGFPDRITLEDAAPGESLLLVNYTHLDVVGPYRASHAIFVKEDAAAPATFIDTIPPMLRSRLLSVRAYDQASMMTEADVVEGTHVAALLERRFDDPLVQEVHVHTAHRGCFLARVERF